jgi:hypothetical protein
VYVIELPHPPGAHSNNDHTVHARTHALAVSVQTLQLLKTLLSSGMQRHILW